MNGIVTTDFLVHILFFNELYVSIYETVYFLEGKLIHDECKK